MISGNWWLSELSRLTVIKSIERKFFERDLSISESSDRSTGKSSLFTKRSRRRRYSQLRRIQITIDWINDYLLQDFIFFFESDEWWTSISSGKHSLSVSWRESKSRHSFNVEKFRRIIWFSIRKWHATWRERCVENLDIDFARIWARRRIVISNRLCALSFYADVIITVILIRLARNWDESDWLSQVVEFVENATSIAVSMFSMIWAIEVANIQIFQYMQSSEDILMSTLSLFRNDLKIHEWIFFERSKTCKCVNIFNK